MKSLAESILSSTDSGKNKKIDVEYLLKHGFAPSYDRTMFVHKETGNLLKIARDEIVLDIIKHDGIFTRLLVVSTVEELDLVIKWFKACKYNNSNSEKEKLRKELFKNLKEL